MPRPQRKAPAYDHEKVLALLDDQAGVVSRRQLDGLGVTPADIRRLLRRRLLFRLSAGIYTRSNGTPTPLQRLWWACLHHGRAAAADESALELARDATGSLLTLPLHVAVPAGHHASAVPHVVPHRVAQIDAVVAWHARPARMHAAHAALRVASRAETEDALVSALADAVNWRVTKPRRLLDALAQHPRLPRRALIRTVLADLIDGACSILEREYLRRVERAHGLPPGQRQTPRRTPGGMEFRDVTYQSFRLVVELVGRAFHSGKQAWDADLERDLDDLVAENDTARLGWRQVFGTPCLTAGKLAVIFANRGWTGTPRPCGPNCALTA